MLGDDARRGVTPVAGKGAVKVETEEGRKLYQKHHMDVMEEGKIARNELLRAYNSLLENVFGIDENIGINETND